MKKLFLFLICTLSAGMICGQSMPDSVKNKLNDDINIYREFLQLGKCYTLDVLMHDRGEGFSGYEFPALFNNHYNTLSGLNCPLPKIIYKNAIYDRISYYYSENIDELLCILKSRDEKFKLAFHSPLLIAELLFSENDSTKELYNKLIADDSAYTYSYNSIENYYIGVFRSITFDQASQ